MKIGRFSIGFEGRKKKNSQELLAEADAFIQSGEYAAAVGRFREAVELKKDPLMNPQQDFFGMIGAMESHAIKTMPPTGAETADEFILEGGLRIKGFKNFADVAREFELNGIFMSEEELAKAVTPEALRKLEEALRPAGVPKKNV